MEVDLQSWFVWDMGLSMMNRRQSQAPGTSQSPSQIKFRDRTGVKANSLRLSLQLVGKLLTLSLFTSCDLRDLLWVSLTSSSHLIIFIQWEPVGFCKSSNKYLKAGRKIMFINYDNSNDHVAPLPPPLPSYCHLTHSGGSSLTPDLTLFMDLEQFESL